MKFYNPFKWHIIEQGGRFWVRQFSILGWLHMSNGDDAVYLWVTRLTACSFSSLEKAEDKLKKYPEILRKYKESQKIKVHV